MGTRLHVYYGNYQFRLFRGVLSLCWRLFPNDVLMQQLTSRFVLEIKSVQILLLALSATSLVPSVSKGEKKMSTMRKRGKYVPKNTSFFQSEACESCPKGKYNNHAGASSCEQQPGSYATLGAPECYKVCTRTRASRARRQNCPPAAGHLSRQCSVASIVILVRVARESKVTFL